MSDQINIAERSVGEDSDVFVIAEVAQAHDGSLGAAHAYIDAVATTGASAIKFQTHLAAHESTAAEPWRVKFSRQDDTRFDYWRRMEFTKEQWRGLAEHCAQVGLLFLSSAFSPAAVELLAPLVPAWKVASGEVTNPPLLALMAKTKKPVLLSSGLSSWAELDAAAQRVRDAKAPLAILQATTAYPCPPEKWGLNVLAQLQQRYKCPVGLSDHSSTVHAGIAAVALGASILETHVVFSKDCFGPDTSSSLTIPELKELVRGGHLVRTALRHPVDKDQMAQDSLSLRSMFGKSVVAAHPIAAGTSLSPDNLALKKPGTGMPATRFEELIGRVCARDLAQDHVLTEDDLV